MQEKKTSLTSVSFGRSCHLSVLQRLAVQQHRALPWLFTALISCNCWIFIIGFSWGAAVITFDKWSYCRFMTILNFCCAASHGEVAAIQNWQCMATSLGQGAHGEKWTCEKRFIAVRNSWGSSFSRKAWSGAYISNNTDVPVKWIITIMADYWRGCAPWSIVRVSEGQAGRLQ